LTINQFSGCNPLKNLVGGDWNHGIFLVNLWLIMVNNWNNNISGWWFGTFGLFFHILGIVTPSDELHHFSERWLNHQSVTVWTLDGLDNQVTHQSLIATHPHPMKNAKKSRC
jgi:hypothetical protein